MKDGITSLDAGNGLTLARNTATDEILAVYKMGEHLPKLNANNPITPSGEPTIGSGNLSTSKK